MKANWLSNPVRQAWLSVQPKTGARRNFKNAWRI
jgi:hypothetical protein